MRLGLPQDDALAAFVILGIIFGLSWLAQNMWVVWLVGIVCLLAGAVYWWVTTR